VHGRHPRRGPRCTTLTPPDPQLKGAWNPGSFNGFNPYNYHVINRFQNVRFKCNRAPLRLGFISEQLQSDDLTALYPDAPPSQDYITGKGHNTRVHTFVCSNESELPK
jgi:hypothetical protein